MKVLIVGGVAGGASAAARLRRLDEKCEICILERGDHISYANCGLPYYIGGVIPAEKSLLLQTPESFYRRFNAQVLVRHEMTALLPDTRQAAVRNLETGETRLESYDKLILSPGAYPINPFGKEALTLRSVGDAARIRSFCEEGNISSVLVIGGGFIGLEVAENLLAVGIGVTVAEKAAHLLPNLDGEMAVPVEKKLREMGAKLYLSCGVQSLKNGEALLDNGEKLQAELTVCAIGNRPDTEFLRSSPIALNGRGAILVNERMETSLPDVYAVGDAVAVKNSETGKIVAVPLAGPANRQGRLAADVICGREGRYLGALGTAILKLGDMTIASTGAPEKTLLAEGIAYSKSYTHSLPHAGYYPGGKMMAVKLLFTPDGQRVLGGPDRGL